MASSRMSSARRRTAALLVLSRALAGDVGESQHVEWDEVLALATELLLGPALWSAAHERHDRIPPAVAEQLRQQYLWNIVHNHRFQRSLTDAVLALNMAGVVPLLFKGALHLADRMPRAVEDRLMVDLDVLVPADQMRAAEQALEGLGYEARPGKPFSHPHELPFDHDGSPGPIELHVTLGSPPVPTVLPTAEAWMQSTEISIGDGHARALSPTHQVLHNVLHSAVQDRNHVIAGLPLRQLLTLCRLVETYGSAIDWAMIGRRMEEHGLARQLRDHLWLAHRFTGMNLPDPNRSLWSRLHETRVLVSFALGWPAHLQRNVQDAMGRDYLDSLYHHGNQPLKLSAARIRHTARLLRQQRRKVISMALSRWA
jgi:hypothetical protein